MPVYGSVPRRAPSRVSLGSVIVDGETASEVVVRACVVGDDAFGTVVEATIDGEVVVVVGAMVVVTGATVVVVVTGATVVVVVTGATVVVVGATVVEVTGATVVVVVTGATVVVGATVVEVTGATVVVVVTGATVVVVTGASVVVVGATVVVVAPIPNPQPLTSKSQSLTIVSARNWPWRSVVCPRSVSALRFQNWPHASVSRAKEIDRWFEFSGQSPRTQNWAEHASPRWVPLLKSILFAMCMTSAGSVSIVANLSVMSLQMS